jgi:hypothetical protein
MALDLIEFNNYGKYLEKLGLSEEARIIDEYVSYRLVDIG